MIHFQASAIPLRYPDFLRLQINLGENTYSLTEAALDQASLFSKTGFADIVFHKRIYTQTIQPRGILDDQALVGLTRIIELSKKQLGPAGQQIALFPEILAHLADGNIHKKSILRQEEVLQVMHWLDEIKQDTGIQTPKLALVRLNRICQALYGCNAAPMLREIKMNIAYRNVLTSDESLLNIGLKAGFGDRSYFITAFKKTFALTPGALRLHYRQPAFADCEKN